MGQKFKLTRMGRKPWGKAHALHSSPARAEQTASGSSASSLPRRKFLAALAASAAAVIPVVRTAAAQAELTVLKEGGLDRLRMDFNANRGKVRILSILSPT